MVNIIDLFFCLCIQSNNMLSCYIFDFHSEMSVHTNKLFLVFVSHYIPDLFHHLKNCLYLHEQGNIFSGWKHDLDHSNIWFLLVDQSIMSKNKDIYTFPCCNKIFCMLNVSWTASYEIFVVCLFICPSVHPSITKFSQDWVISFF